MRNDAVHQVIKFEVAKTVADARLAATYAHQVRSASIVVRQQAAALCQEAERLLADGRAVPRRS